MNYYPLSRAQRIEQRERERKQKRLDKQIRRLLEPELQPVDAALEWAAEVEDLVLNTAECW